MSDAPATPPPTDAAAAAAAAAAKPAAGPALPLLLGAAAGALVIGAVAGMFLVGPMVVKGRAASALASADGHGGAKPGGKEGKKHGGKEGGKTGLFKLENIIVNPAGSQGTRFLMTTVAIELADEKEREVLSEREVQIRDRVVTVLEACSMEQLMLPGVRDSLRARIAIALEPVLGDEVSHFTIYMPQFVIQ